MIGCFEGSHRYNILQRNALGVVKNSKYRGHRTYAQNRYVRK